MQKCFCRNVLGTCTHTHTLMTPVSSITNLFTYWNLHTYTSVLSRYLWPLVLLDNLNHPHMQTVAHNIHRILYVMPLHHVSPLLQHIAVASNFAPTSMQHRHATYHDQSCSYNNRLLSRTTYKCSFSNAKELLPYAYSGVWPIRSGITQSHIFQISNKHTSGVNHAPFR